VCWLSTAAIFRQPSIRRNLIYPLATRLKSRTSEQHVDVRVLPKRLGEDLEEDPCHQPLESPCFIVRQWSAEMLF